MFALPAGAVMFTEQLEEFERSHVTCEGRRVDGTLVNVTVPVGAIGVPGEVSVTVKLHVVD